MARKSRWDTIVAQDKASPVDWTAVAKDCIRVYFDNKQWYCGGPVPECELFSDFSVQTILRTRFDKRWEDLVHDKCLPVIPNTSKEDLGNLTWEVRCLINILNEMGSLWIPKEFRPGMTLLYFKFCKAVEIPGPPLL